MAEEETGSFYKELENLAQARDNVLQTLFEFANGADGVSSADFLNTVEDFINQSQNAQSLELVDRVVLGGPVLDSVREALNYSNNPEVADTLRQANDSLLSASIDVLSQSYAPENSQFGGVAATSVADISSISPGGHGHTA